jgi:hypothetical protein
LLARGVVLAACTGDDSTAPPPSARGIQIVAGAGVTDTVGSSLRQPLIIEVRDSAGKLAPLGTVVQFEGVVFPENGAREAYVRRLSSTAVDVLAAETTDAAGRTAINVQLGLVAGPSRVVISVPTLGLRDTARFTATPASASRLSVSPPDTGMYVGKVLQLRGVVTDLYGNTRNDPVEWSTLSTGISVTTAGRLTALQVGRYSISATAASRSTISYVSVVPAGRIAAWTGSRIVAVDLDGSNFRDLAAAAYGDVGAQPRWIPGSNTIVFAHWDGITQHLQTVNDSGSVRRFFATRPAEMLHQAEPEPSANGEWLYFSAQDTRCVPYYYCLYRARIDGSSPELLGTHIAPGSWTMRPAPSPDGGRVAFVTDEGGPVIRVFDVAARSVSPWKVVGQNPSWSPTGADIAFVRLEGPIMLMSPDGRGMRRVTEQLYDPQPLGWSRDGRWLLAASPTALDLIEVSSGAVLPLSHLRGLSAPSLK